MNVHEREAKWQARWNEEKLFEATPEPGREKFFCTFPYPYVNGLPHVGHLFTMMRVEALARYHRHRGKAVLFPQGFHATGSPIVAAANRVKEGEAKQIKILKDFGVPEEEISAFAKAEHWIEYFVPRYREDLENVGMSIDWRRTFTTTSLNPQYDAFVRWQFLRLREKGYVEQGSHAVVWCPKDNGPVGDHDRLQGEGETPQEFLLVKHRLGDGRFVVSATLRPDTILGVTNLYMNPKTEYVQARVGEETWILGDVAVERLQQQGRNIERIGNVAGSELIGQEVDEFSGGKVPILPATFLDPAFGTGLVHSVPSDSADDLIALRDLQSDEKTLEKYGLDIDRVKRIEPIPVLETPGIGGVPAEHFLAEYGVKNQNDRKKLDEIKEKLYKLSFYESTFNDKYKAYGLAGKPVQEGKEVMQNAIIEKGWGSTMYQLTGKVVCRCTTEAIVNIVSNQWFVTYDKEEWKSQAREALGEMRLYPEKARTQFEHVIEWLRSWACTREYGLGTRLPWDEEWLIESLSDSTVYMAYYTIAHHIKETPAEHLKPEFFDYIFLGKGDLPKVPGLDVESLRREFLYWYPLDFRNSGKDLIQNHLTFMIFTHCAIFPKELWPKSIGVNGWVTVNGQKMSKSLGNVIPLRNLKAEYGADATRMTILNGGEGMDDPNWDSDFARALHGKIENMLRMAESLASAKEKPTVFDASLQSVMHRLTKKITEAMESANFRTAIQIVFFEYNESIRQYIILTDGGNPALLREALSRQIVMLAPFIPHACEEAWELLGNDTLVSIVPWPNVDEQYIDENAEQDAMYISDLLASIRKSLAGKEASLVTLYPAEAWKSEFVERFKTAFSTVKNPRDLSERLAGEMPDRADMVRTLTLSVHKNQRLLPNFARTAEQEIEVLKIAVDALSQTLGLAVKIGSVQDNHPKAGNGMPGKPAIVVE